MDYRKVAYDRIVAVLPSVSVMSAGSVDTIPETKPFIIVAMGVFSTRINHVAGSQPILVYVHDEPGSYARIDNHLETIKNAMVADPTASEGGMVGMQWLTRSGDLADDYYRTVMRYDTYLFSGRHE